MESQITIRLPKDGQSTNKKYTGKAFLVRKCRLHPLIHTSLGFAQAQDVEKKKAEPKTSHFLSLNQDVVDRSKGEKWVLKYGMQGL